ncbi:MAG: class I SAM-dependent methyltransferase [Thermoplasmata archaeon]|nr:class I SAM-dependent methyltransferase [Thermoplasmata archaeon]
MIKAKTSLGAYWRELKARTIVPWRLGRDFHRTYRVEPLPGARARRRLVDKAVRECGLGERYSVGPWLNEVLYNFTRIARPDVIVETGVHYGISSAYWLMALEANQKGTLYSIDLPCLTPEGQVNADGVRDLSYVTGVDQTGVVVKRMGLTARWKLLLGDARTLLPGLLADLGRVGFFYHDSDHSYEHQSWEYRTAWPYIAAGGWLMSDDVQWTPAFTEFSQGVGQAPKTWLNQLGVLQKGTLVPSLRSA